MTQRTNFATVKFVQFIIVNTIIGRLIIPETVFQETERVGNENAISADSITSKFHRNKYGIALFIGLIIAMIIGFVIVENRLAGTH